MWLSAVTPLARARTFGVVLRTVRVVFLDRGPSAKAQLLSRLAATASAPAAGSPYHPYYEDVLCTVHAGESSKHSSYMPPRQAGTAGNPSARTTLLGMRRRQIRREIRARNIGLLGQVESFHWLPARIWSL